MKSLVFVTAVACAMSVISDPSTAQEPAGTLFQDCSDCPEMIVVPSGTFLMGTPETEPQREADEGPQVEVTFGYNFAVSRFEITKAEYAKFAEETGFTSGNSCYIIEGAEWAEKEGHDWTDIGFKQSGNEPVGCINWFEAEAYTKWLSEKTDKPYRLLSEAEWEYAARAGTTTIFSFGDQVTPTHANYNAAKSYNGAPTGPYWAKTLPVGSYAPNAFGLYDMHGNMFEWVADCWQENLAGSPADGSVWNDGADCEKRSWRGGGWFNDPQSLRSGLRDSGAPTVKSNDIGFRVALSLSN